MKKRTLGLWLGLERESDGVRVGGEQTLTGAQGKPCGGVAFHPNQNDDSESLTKARRKGKFGQGHGKCKGSEEETNLVCSRQRRKQWAAIK